MEVVNFFNLSQIFKIFEDYFKIYFWIVINLKMQNLETY